MNKEQILEFMRENQNAHLATIEDDKPRVRAMGIYKIGKDGVIIQTFKSKDVCKQMEENPEVEICFNNYKERIQIRVRGIVQEIKEDSLKEKCLEERLFLKKFVDEGKKIALFYLKNPEAHIWTIEKNFEPKEFIKLY